MREAEFLKIKADSSIVLKTHRWIVVYLLLNDTLHVFCMPKIESQSLLTLFFSFFFFFFTLKKAQLKHDLAMCFHVTTAAWFS